MSECKRPFEQRKNKREQGKLARVPHQQQQQQKHCQLTLLLLTVWRRRRRQWAPHYHFGIRLSVSQGNVNFNNHTCTQRAAATNNDNEKERMARTTAQLNCHSLRSISSISFLVCVCIILSRQRASYIFASKRSGSSKTNYHYTLFLVGSPDTFFFFFIFFRQCQWEKWKVKKKGKESATLAMHSAFFGGTLQQKRENLRAEKSTHSQT